jgi:hypothetical protein
VGLRAVGVVVIMRCMLDHVGQGYNLAPLMSEKPLIGTVNERPTLDVVEVGLALSWTFV